MTKPLLRLIFLTVAVLSLRRAGFASDVPSAVAVFLEQHCHDCHTGTDAEAGLDLTRLNTDLTDSVVMKRWVRVFDRVAEGEMPPADAGPVEQPARQQFLATTDHWISGQQQRIDEQSGRVRARRLTRRELERSLHDLLGIDIPLADQLPEEGQAAEFSTVAGGQSISHFQLAAYLTVVDQALDESWRRAFSEADRYEKDFSPREIARRDPKRRTREPEMRDGLAVIWSSGLIFYGRIPATTAPQDGWYRFRLRVSGLKLPETGGVWSTVRTGLCVSSAPLLPWVTAFEAEAEPKDIEFDAWLPRGHMLEIRPGDSTLKSGRFAGGQVGVGEGEPQELPGIAFHRLTMDRVHHGPDNEELRQLLFHDTPVSMGDRRTPGRLESRMPADDLQRLLASFASRAFRRPVSEAELKPFVEMASNVLQESGDLAAAVRVGYRTILCSPRFLYFAEEPGALDDWAVANRLSYFLTGSLPDERLAKLAASGKLRTAEQLRAEADRLLAADGGRQFVQDFAAEWLDLRLIDFTEPDRKLYPGFDAIVQNAMLDETHTFLQTMLQENRGVVNLVDSDDTWLNSRLARYYAIPGVEGDELRRVELPEDSHRGGLLTQGAILKVTANGSTTSPVIRGVWVSERLLGQPIPPPPANVPAIEPDIRGATSIREMLAKHRDQASCASCHVRIDPPGFALENFDPSGRWREHYLLVSGGRREKGPRVDPAYTLPDGRSFADLDEFRSLVAASPRGLARNVVDKLITFGTGASISFADRKAVEEIVEAAADDNYGMRSLLYGVIMHPIFLRK